MSEQSGDGPRVRVRGIYATALTKLLQESSLSVVDASTAINRRFDAAFADGEADVTVAMTDDRQGVGIHGEAQTVDAVAGLVTDVGIDTFAWQATAARGALYDGEIVDTNRGGAIVSLVAGDDADGDDGTAEQEQGFLPFGATEDYLDVGDTVRVQVHEPRPPWASDRPVLGTEIRAVGGIATLVRGVDALVADTPDGSPQHELARTTEMLSTDVPDDWGVRWEYGADEAAMDVLDDALARAVERAEAIDTALESAERAESTGALAGPDGTRWVWFGRESRFALDDHRDAVTHTMPGHHRIKAGSRDAGTAVDFAEHLGSPSEDFPFEAVTDVFGPGEGSTVRIRHGKPAGHCITLGEGAVTDRSVEKRRITVERSISSRGTYDALGTDREPGDVAITRYAEGRWWAPTVYRGEEGEHKGTYVNVATPVELFPRTVRYLDLHVDVIKRPDGEVEVVDEEELADAVAAEQVPDAVAEKARTVAARVADAFAE